MKKKPIMTPQDVIETINRIFDEAIIVTDVGQHQMFTAQFIEITEKKKLLMSGGLGTMGYGMPGAIGAKIGNPDVPVISISGRRRISDEQSGARYSGVGRTPDHQLYLQ